jgi:SAM-dependent methyltransferase
MENRDEAVRLELKTDPKKIRQDARWCRIKPGMLVLDAGCGPGKTTSILHRMTQPGGNAVGIDFSDDRVAYARDHYGHRNGIAFYTRDLTQSLEDLGPFDVIWVRFVLQYFHRDASRIIENLRQCLKPGGTLCLIDLDNYFLSHYELSPQMEGMLQKIMKILTISHNFDPYIGRKLYAYLYDLGFEDIKVHMQAYNLIYGKLEETHLSNWMKKLEVNASRISKLFKDYPGGYTAFQDDFWKFMLSERRFSYTPMVLCKGNKPMRG